MFTKQHWLSEPSWNSTVGTAGSHETALLLFLPLFRLFSFVSTEMKRPTGPSLSPLILFFCEIFLHSFPNHAFPTVSFNKLHYQPEYIDGLVVMHGIFVIFCVPFNLIALLRCRNNKLCYTVPWKLSDILWAMQLTVVIYISEYYKYVKWSPFLR